MTTLNLKFLVQGCYDTANNGLVSEQPATVKVYGAEGAVLETKTGTLATDGTLQVELSTTGAHRIGVRTWNSLEVLTASEVDLDGTTVDYDFTDAAEKAYGDNQVEVAEGVYALYSGDVNQNGTIDESDLTLVSNASDNSQYGIVICDLNSDENVDLSDVSIVTNNIGKSVATPW